MCSLHGWVELLLLLDLLLCSGSGTQTHLEVRDWVWFFCSFCLRCMYLSGPFAVSGREPERAEWWGPPGLESPGLREVLCSSAMFGSAGSSVCGSWSSPRRALGSKRLRVSRQVWSAAGADVLRVLLGFSAVPQELLQQRSENGGVKFQLWAEKGSDRNIPACWTSIQQNNTFYKQERHFNCLMQFNSLIFDIVWFVYLHLLHYSEEN